MKKIVIAALAATSFAATPAFGQATNQVNIGATVASACGTGNHISGPGTAPGFTSGDIENIDLDQGNGQFNTPIVFNNRSFGNIWCNGPANVAIEVSALRNSTTVSDTGSFTNLFDIEVTTDAGVYLAGGSENFVISSADGGASHVQTVGGHVPFAFETGTGRFGGADSIRILPAARSAGGNYRPIAGDYSGYVKMTATPAP